MKDRVVLVTGGGRGIGRAIAGRFATDGARVVAIARNAAELGETERLIRDAGGHCTVMTCDVSRYEQVASTVEAVQRDFGRVDVLVNNAGAAAKAGIDEIGRDTFDVLVDTNIRGLYYATMCVWPVMRHQGGGTIVNISSVAAVEPFPGFATYGASKAWVNAITRGLAEEGRPHHIRVIAVGPGAVETRMLRGPFPDFPADQALAPQDVADAVLGLCRPEFAHTTGQVVYVRR